AALRACENVWGAHGLGGQARGSGGAWLRQAQGARQQGLYHFISPPRGHPVFSLCERKTGSYVVGRFGGQSPPKNPFLFPPTCGGIAATGGWKKKVLGGQRSRVPSGWPPLTRQLRKA